MSMFKRYCYKQQQDALIASATWDGDGDPPGDWIVEGRRRAALRTGIAAPEGDGRRLKFY
jgi:hypothetical protein